ncbi:hypothetical protein HBO07_08035 [Pseudomonas proteolytica]|uniref:hypothetical protein n=1 Tax=Pseudomonas proteolytica TaxID=219574 RepID=UPI001473745A|nr:hypothetical protein [Pseudomonas proteolytica]NMZ11230.1 hypothetical protein [Pseudomonas proteolytica]
MIFTLRIGILPNHLKIKVILAKHAVDGGQQNAFLTHLNEIKKGQPDKELTSLEIATQRIFSTYH